MFLCCVFSFEERTFVSRTAKYIAWITLIVCNFFFVYYTIILCFIHGKAFQLEFVNMAILQFIFEVAFYETTECISINYFIPQIAYKEFQSAYEIVSRSAKAACSCLSRRNFSLNAPNYLYASTNTTFYFPESVASKIIQSYRSYVPVERLGKHKSNTHLSYWHIPSFTVFSLLLILLRQFGTMSHGIQSFFIHLVQPCIIMAVAYLWIFMYTNPIIFLPFSVIVIFLLYSLVSYNATNSSEVSPEDYVETEKEEDKPVNAKYKTLRGVLTDRDNVPDALLDLVYKIDNRRVDFYQQDADDEEQARTGGGGKATNVINAPSLESANKLRNAVTKASAKLSVIEPSVLELSTSKTLVENKMVLKQNEKTTPVLLQAHNYRQVISENYPKSATSDEIMFFLDSLQENHSSSKTVISHVQSVDVKQNIIESVVPKKSLILKKKQLTEANQILSANKVVF